MSRGGAGAPSLALVGCGHIGGSFALALKRAGAVARVVGADADAARAARAAELGICDDVAASAAEAAAGADLVVLAVPVRALAAVAAEVAPALAEGAVVTDVGSTKTAVVRACERALAGRARFVGGHPIAGTERSGPDAADAGLFTGRRVILTPTAATDTAAKTVVADLWRAAGAEVLEVAPERHDRIFAAVSHLPHVVAYTLAGALAPLVHEVAGFAGTSFTDVTRVAATDPAIWVDIFLDNREALLPILDLFGARLEALRHAIVAGDASAIAHLLAEARATRHRIL